MPGSAKEEAVDSSDLPWGGASSVVLQHLLPFLAFADVANLVKLGAVRALLETGELAPLRIALAEAHRIDACPLLAQKPPISAITSTNDASPRAAALAAPHGQESYTDRLLTAPGSVGGSWKGSPAFAQLLRNDAAVSRLKELVVPGVILSRGQVKALCRLDQLEVLDISNVKGEQLTFAGVFPKFASTLKVLRCGGHRNPVVLGWMKESNERKAGCFARIESLSVTIETADEAELLLDGLLAPFAAAGHLRRLELESSRVCHLFKFTGARADAVRQVCAGLHSLALVGCELTRAGPGGVNAASSEAAAWLAEGLLHCTQLRELRIVDPALPRMPTKAFMAPVFDALAGSGCPIKSIEISANGSSVNDTLQNRRFYADNIWERTDLAAEQKPKLLVGDGIVHAMLEGSGRGTFYRDLSRLSLFDSSLSDDIGLRYLACAEFTRLRELNLSGSVDITDEGIEAFLAPSSMAPTLHILRLDGCRGIRSGSTLHSIARELVSLRELHIRGLHHAVDLLLTAAGKSAMEGDVRQTVHQVLFPPATTTREFKVFYLPKPVGSAQLPPPFEARPEPEPMLLSFQCSACSVVVMDPEDFEDHLILCRGMLHPCPLAPDGCPFRGTSVAVGSHLRDCPLNRVACPYYRCCREILRRHECNKHCQRMHDDAAEELTHPKLKRCPNAGLGCAFREKHDPLPGQVGSVMEHLSAGLCHYAEYVCSRCGAEPVEDGEGGAAATAGAGASFIRKLSRRHHRRWHCGTPDCAARSIIRCGLPDVVLLELKRRLSTSTDFINVVLSRREIERAPQTAQSALPGPIVCPCASDAAWTYSPPASVARENVRATADSTGGLTDISAAAPVGAVLPAELLRAAVDALRTRSARR